MSGGVTVIVDGDTSQSANVNPDGQLATISQTISNSLAASVKGDRYNVSTDQPITLTDDVESAILYLQNNEPETTGWAVTQLTIVTGASNVVGDWLVGFLINPTSGTIITSGAESLIISQNLGSQKPLTATAKLGGTGFTVTSLKQITRLIPMTPASLVIQLDAIVMPPGTSMAITMTPPIGNTDMKVDVGVAVLRLEA